MFHRASATAWAALVAASVMMAACAPAPARPDATTSGSGSVVLTDIAPGLQPVQEHFTQPGPSDSSSGPEVNITVQSAGPGASRFQAGNVGLSFEASDLADPRWDPDQSTLDELVAALDQPALRFGGNSVDRRVFWTSSDEAAPDWASTTLRPADLDRLARFARATKATVTLTVDLGHYDPERAADFAYHAHSALGDALVGIAIGNEPNGFNLESQPQLRIRTDSWGPDAYLTEANAYVDAILARTPDAPIVGPGAYDGAWLQAFAQASLPNTVALTQHWYPLWSCDGSSEPRAAPDVDNLASPWLHQRAASILGIGITHARKAQLPLWLEETGPTSCPGTNPTSRTHAQALWTVDYLLQAAQLGVGRAALHSALAPCDGGPPMSTVCTEASTSDPNHAGDRIIGQSSWLALDFVAQTRSGAIALATVAGSDRTYAYTITDASGIDLVIVDLRDPATVGRSPLRIDGLDNSRVIAVSQLAGPSLGARNQTTLVPLSPAELPATSRTPKRLDADSPLQIPGLASLNPATATLIRLEPAPAAASRG